MSKRVKRKTWRCFHCDEVFRGAVRAALHFGSKQCSTTVCQLDASKVREMEEQLAKYREEDTELHRQFNSLEAKHAVALRRAEEAGYNKGLRDGMALPKKLA